MANQVDLVVKKNDETTNITYTGVQPSSGDNTAAIWQSQTVGTSLSHRPELHLTAKASDESRKRALRVTFVYPQIATNSTTGITSVVQRCVFSVNFTIPRDMSVVDVNEAVAQFANLLASASMKSYVKSGYSAS